MKKTAALMARALDWLKTTPPRARISAALVCITCGILAGTGHGWASPLLLSGYLLIAFTGEDE